MSEALQEIKDFRRQKLRELLLQCTEAQQVFFNRLCGSVEEISDEKIDSAIQLCERTIEGNKAIDEKSESV